MDCIEELMNSAKNKEELDAFTNMIEIILCLEKHKHLNREE